MSRLLFVWNRAGSAASERADHFYLEPISLKMEEMPPQVGPQSIYSSPVLSLQPGDIPVTKDELLSLDETYFRKKYVCMCWPGFHSLVVSPVQSVVRRWCRIGKKGNRDGISCFLKNYWGDID